jgi:hypothetical protein
VKYQGDIFYEWNLPFRGLSASASLGFHVGENA